MVCYVFPAPYEQGQANPFRVFYCLSSYFLLFCYAVTQKNAFDGAQWLTIRVTNFFCAVTMERKLFLKRSQKNSIQLIQTRDLAAYNSAQHSLKRRCQINPLSFLNRPLIENLGGTQLELIWPIQQFELYWYPLPIEQHVVPLPSLNGRWKLEGLHAPILLWGHFWQSRRSVDQKIME